MLAPPQAGEAPILSVEGLTKSFFGVRVLHGVGFAVRPGEALGLVGENGSGKSTSMNILGGVHQPDGGAMRLAGVPYAPQNPRTRSGPASPSSSGVEPLPQPVR
jgi:ABC-type sugar transport system ATPase subunit